MAAEEKKMSGIDAVEEGFRESPELSPIEQLEVDEYIAPEEEIREDLKAAGIEVPEPPEKEPVPIKETAIGLEEESFVEEPELSPIEQLEVDEFIASPEEIADDMKKAGL